MEVETRTNASEEIGKGGDAFAAGVAERSATRYGETLFRVLPIALCVAAMVVMLKNSELSDIYGSLSYDDLGGFQYLVYANGFCAGYSLFSALFLAMPYRSNMISAWALYLLDQVLTYVVLTAATASTEILYLAYEGNQEVTWSEACGAISGFCRKAKTSVGITYAAVACYVVLSVLSAFRLFSSYDPPIPFLHKAVEVAAVDG